MEEDNRPIVFEARVDYAPGIHPPIVVKGRIPAFFEIPPGPLAEASPEDKSRLAYATSMVMRRVLDNTVCEAWYTREGDAAAAAPLQYTYEPKVESKRQHERRKEKRQAKLAHWEQRRQQRRKQEEDSNQKSTAKRERAWDLERMRMRAAVIKKLKQALPTSDESQSSSGE